MNYDAIVVGAGLSGLVCATRLRAAGRSVLVLEARDRVGGRLLTGTIAGTTIDLGGQWMSVGQPRLAALASSLGIRSFPQRRDGDPLFAIDDRHRIASAIARWRAARQIERLAKSPPNADTSLADWLATNVRRETAADLIALHAELVFAMDASSLSLLNYLDVFARTGGFSPKGPDLPGGGREHRFVGGAQSIALALAAALGDVVRLSSPVRAITPAAAGAATRTDVVPDMPVVVRTDTDELHARRVVLAIPPSLARKIAMPLPDSFPPSRLGPVVKCFAAYPTAFWRDTKLSGEAFRPSGPVRATVALDPPPRPEADHRATDHRATDHRATDHHATDHRATDHRATDHRATDGAAILLAFVVGEEATMWRARSTADRRDLVIATLVEQFGEQAASPLDYLEVDWSLDPWSTGCVASLAPDYFVPPSSWRAPHGAIHFAGTETAEAWPGYMEGAIEAGERAADEVIAATAAATASDVPAGAP